MKKISAFNPGDAKKVTHFVICITCAQGRRNASISGARVQKVQNLLRRALRPGAQMHRTPASAGPACAHVLVALSEANLTSAN